MAQDLRLVSVKGVLFLTPACRRKALLICSGKSQRGRGCGKQLIKIHDLLHLDDPFASRHSWTEQITFITASLPTRHFHCPSLSLAILLFLTFYCCPIFSLFLSSLNFALHACHFTALLPVPYVERMRS